MILNSWQMSWMAFSFLPNLLCLIFLVKYYGLVIIHHWIKMWGYLFSWSPHPPTKYLFWGNIWMWGWMGLMRQGTRDGGSWSLSLSRCVTPCLTRGGAGILGPMLSQDRSHWLHLRVLCLLVRPISRCNEETASRALSPRRTRQVP